MSQTTDPAIRPHLGGDQPARAKSPASHDGPAGGHREGQGGAANRSRVRRNRLLLLSWTALVLAIGGFFAHETIRALYVRSVTGSVFADYVLTHHIGRAQISDDESGFQKDFCVLQLNHPIPAAHLTQQMADLMYHYHDLDGGTMLTAAYRTPSGKWVTEADAVYDESRETLILTLHAGGQNRVVKEKVEWASGTDAD
ncbi:MAG: hypothetical protein K6T30_05720 [Alicyclobacillus sp.]|nr:hypothetical protein [Alicyclobacillus sp.]